MSEIGYLHITQNFTEKPQSLSRPVDGGVVNPEWRGEPLPGTSTFYEDVYQVGSDAENLFEFASNLNVSATVRQACILVPHNADHWRGAFITSDIDNTVSVDIKNSWSISKPFAVSVPGLAGSWETRGGQEPGVFVYIDSDPFYYDPTNPQNPDNDCSAPRSRSGVYMGSVDIYNYIESGSKMSMGTYAAIGELSLKDIGVCNGRVAGSQTVYDVEAIPLTLFRDRGVDDGKSFSFRLENHTFTGGGNPSRVTISREPAALHANLDIYVFSEVNGIDMISTSSSNGYDIEDVYVRYEGSDHYVKSGMYSVGFVPAQNGYPSPARVGFAYLTDVGVHDVVVQLTKGFRERIIRFEVEVLP